MSTSNPTTPAETKPEEDTKVVKKDVKTFIKFVGHNGVRTISEEDWKGIEVENQKDSTWDRTNAWRLESKDFSVKALNYLLNVDGEFIEED